MRPARRRPLRWRPGCARMKVTASRARGRHLHPIGARPIGRSAAASAAAGRRSGCAGTGRSSPTARASSLMSVARMIGSRPASSQGHGQRVGLLAGGAGDRPDRHPVPPPVRARLLNTLASARMASGSRMNQVVRMISRSISAWRSAGLSSAGRATAPGVMPPARGQVAQGLHGGVERVTDSRLPVQSRNRSRRAATVSGAVHRRPRQVDQQAAQPFGLLAHGAAAPGPAPRRACSAASPCSAPRR